ncbi:hypothetical protein ACN28S_41180 [Cystobacter fuscus]
MATAARIPMMATTIISSMSVKPRVEGEADWRMNESRGRRGRRAQAARGRVHL